MEVVLQDYRQIVLSNDVVTGNGSAVFDGFGSKELNLLINVSGSVTGTTPTLTFTVQEVDAGDQTTALGNSKSGTAIIATGTQVVSLPIMYGGTVKVSWVIGGTGSPTFNGVYASLISKTGGTTTLYGADGSPVTGTAGVPGTAVVTVQGVSGGQPIPISGSITATNPSVGTNNTAIPTSSTQVGGSDGTNLQAARVFDLDSGGGTQYVLGVGLRKTSSGGSVEAGTASDPLRVDPTGTTTQPVSGTVTSNQGTPNSLANGWPVKVTDGTNTMPTGDAAGRAIFQKITDGTNGPVAVKAASTAPLAADPALVVVLSPNQQAIPVTMMSDRTSTGTITSTQNVAISTQGSGSSTVQITGSWTGTIVFEATTDGTTWNPINGVVPTTGAQTTSTTANGVWEFGTAGYSQLRIRGNTVGSGTATVFIEAGAGAQVVVLDAPLPTGTNTIGAVNQGTPNSNANRWPVQVTDGTNTMPTGDAAARAIFQKITDGTNGPAAVKPASTAALATDPALVVAISPNNSISVTTADVTNTGALGALNANVAVTTPGLATVGMQLATGTLVGTIVPEISYDGGTTWVGTFFDDPTTGNTVSSIVFGVANTATARTIIGAGGAGQVRVRVSAFTSGTANVTLRASDILDPSTLHEGAAGSALPPTVMQAGGSDGTLLRAFSTDTSGRQLVVGPAATGAAIVGNPVTIGVATDNGLVGALALGEANRLRTGQETILWLDTFDGSTINTVRWTQSTSTLTQAQTQTSFNMNSGNSTTANAYSILTSTKSFLLNGEFALGARIKARVIAQANAVNELGFFTAATNTAPTNGVFMRVDSTGNMRLVICFNSTETTSATLGTLTGTNYYTFVFYMYGTIARLDILNQDNSVFATTTLQMPVTQAALVQTGHLPVAARVYNTASPPASPANNILSSVSVHQLDLSTQMPWEEQLGAMARWANLDPNTGVQLQNNTNNTAPTTITTGTLSNTTAAYTTLGGNFAFNTPASAETDYLLFAYQVPTGFSLFLWSVTISTLVLGAQSSTQPTVLEWGVAVGSSAASLATAGANPPIRQAVGLQTLPKSAGIGVSFTPGQIIWMPKVPIVCFGGKFVQIFVRVISGNATANQINRGNVTVDGILQ